MMSFLREVWRYQWGAPEDPVFRHETAGWSYMGLWRRLRRGCLPLMALLILATMGCCGLSLFGLTVDAGMDSTRFFVLAIAAFIGLLYAGEMIRWITGLLATALTATSISAEVEADTYGLLRLTPIPARRIVLAKFGAAYRQILLPTLAVIVVRLWALVGLISLVVGLAIGAAQSALPSPAPSLPGPLPNPIPVAPTDLLPVFSGAASVGVAVASIVVALVVWLAYIIVEPFLTMMLFASLGMLGSAWSRSRSGGLLVSFGMRVGLGAAGYMLGQLITLFFSLLSVPIAAMPTTPIWFERLVTTNPILLIVVGAVLAILYVLFLVAAQYGISALLLWMASKRAERLPYLT